MSRTVTVLGAGSWGTALAIHLARIGHDVRLWARDPVLASELSVSRCNPTYLPDAVLPDSVTVSASLERQLHGVSLIVSAVPSHGCRAVMRTAAPHVQPAATIVSTTKGLEVETMFRMSEVIQQELPESTVVVLSGPSFATEVADQLPTAVVAAARNQTAAELIQQEFRGPYFRLYGSSDVVGVEIGGSMKNVIAIAAGVVEGLGLGQNALAALVTRGLAEIGRLACAAGAERTTVSGLSGLGDLVLTCTGGSSRNRQVGVELARGRSLADILGGMKMVAEGVKTTGVALALGQRYGIELPIAAQMAAVFAGQTSVRTAVDALMVRRQRAEIETA